MLLFGFGKNWSSYEKRIDALAISAAKKSLVDNFDESLNDKTLTLGAAVGCFL